jgi:hypothetical protein
MEDTIEALRDALDENTALKTELFNSRHGRRYSATPSYTLPRSATQPVSNQADGFHRVVGCSVDLMRPAGARTRGSGGTDGLIAAYVHTPSSVRGRNQNDTCSRQDSLEE